MWLKSVQLAVTVRRLFGGDLSTGRPGRSAQGNRAGMEAEKGRRLVCHQIDHVENPIAANGLAFVSSVTFRRAQARPYIVINAPIECPCRGP